MTRWFERARVVFGDLRAAEPSEIYWRVWAGAASRLGVQRRRFAPPTPEAFVLALPDSAREPEALRTWLRQRPSSFLFDLGDRDRYQQLLLRFPSPSARADALLQDAILLFGSPTRLTNCWDWHADPLSGVQWPASDHWSRVSVVGPPGADVRRVWERNRHRDLFVLGRAYWATGDDRYAQAALERLSSWGDANPPEHGVNWWSNLEVAVRAIAWVWALHFFRDAPGFTAARLWELVRLCWVAGRHLEGNLVHSIRTMPGNHVVADAAGLAVLALAVPELADAPRWRSRALSVLEREADAQVTVDGTHCEESPAYHAFVWELLCLVAVLARRQSIPLPNIWRSLERMAEVLVLTARPDGSLPASGDDDASAAYDLCEEPSRAFVVGAVAAVLFGRPDLKAAVRGPVEAILWLTGPGGLDRWSALPIAEPPAPRITGFGVAVRSSWDRHADWWYMRGGTQSRHTHADALHLEIVVGGDVLVQDSGSGPYNASAEWRQYVRSTRAHNTIVVDGHDQARMHRTFRWLSPLRVDWRQAGPAAGGWYADAEHDGYRRAGLIHRRRVWWRSDWGWLVLDALDGRGTHDVELRWHTKAHAACLGGGAQIVGRGGAVLQLVGAPPLEFDVEAATSGVDDGWLATSYTTLQPGMVVTARAHLRFPALVATFLCPHSKNEPVRLSLDTRPDGICVGLQLSDRMLTLEVPKEGPPRERMSCGS